MPILDHAQTLFTNGREIMRAKNTDYSGASSDPFSNFRASLVLGIQPEVGLMMRVMDKSKRIQSFIANGKMAVANEPVDDAIADKLNYYVLLTGLLAERFRGFFAPCPTRAQLMQLHEALEVQTLKHVNEAAYKAMLLEASVDGVNPLLGELRSIRQGFSHLSALLQTPIIRDATGALTYDELPTQIDQVGEIIVSGLRSVVLMHYHVTCQREQAAQDARLTEKVNAFAATAPIPVDAAFQPAPPVVPPAPPAPVG